MKKKAMFGLLAGVSVLAITGCSFNTKTLDCSTKEDMSGYSLQNRIIVTFEEDKPVYTKMMMDYAFDKEKDASSFEKEMKDELEDANKDGVKTNLNHSGKNVNISLEADFEKMIEFNSGSADEDTTYEEMKDELESADYTCK